jgi:hypothetical protein
MLKTRVGRRVNFAALSNELPERASSNLLTRRDRTDGASLAFDLTMTTTLDAKPWKRLDALLNRLQPGDAITASETVAATRLGRETVDLILTGLTRAELFAQSGDVFVRRSALHVAKPSRRRNPR